VSKWHIQKNPDGSITVWTRPHYGPEQGKRVVLRFDDMADLKARGPETVQTHKRPLTNRP